MKSFRLVLTARNTKHNTQHIEHIAHNKEHTTPNTQLLKHRIQNTAHRTLDNEHIREQ